MRITWLLTQLLLLLLPLLSCSQGQPKGEQAQPLGAPMVDELLQVGAETTAQRPSSCQHCLTIPAFLCSPLFHHFLLMSLGLSIAQDSFLRRLSTQFFQMLHEERAQVSPGLAEQVGCVGWAETSHRREEGGG